MDLRIQLLLCIILCEVLYNEYVVAVTTCPDVRNFTDLRTGKYLSPGHEDKNYYYEGNWPVGVIMQFHCFHIRNATHRFSELPYQHNVFCKRGGTWWVGNSEDSIGYHELGFCGHCPDIIDPCCDVINYTSPFTIPNDTNPFPGWKLNEEINPPEIWPVRTTAFIRCRYGYLPSGISKMTCNFDGSWSKTDCKQIVCEALNLPHGLISYSKSPVEGGYPINTEVSFSCNYGYHLSGPRTRDCEHSGSWNFEKAVLTDGLQTPTCQRVICQILSLPNGLINYTTVTIHGGFPVDTEAIFSCKCGYLLSGPKSRICETSGNWSLSATTCAQISCEALSLTNGQISYEKSSVSGRYPVDTKASLSCNDGYSQFGPIFRTCRSSGSWNSKITTCEMSCKPLEQIGFGHIAYSKSPSIIDGTYPQNNVATFSCNNGFSKTGPEVRTCQVSGMWDKGHQFCMID